MKESDDSLSYQTLETTPTPMVPVFSLNLLPPFMAPNSGKAFLGFSCSELPLSHQHTSKTRCLNVNLNTESNKRFTSLMTITSRECLKIIYETHSCIALISPVWKTFCGLIYKRYIYTKQGLKEAHAAFHAKFVIYKKTD